MRLAALASPQPLQRKRTNACRFFGLGVFQSKAESISNRDPPQAFALTQPRLALAVASFSSLTGLILLLTLLLVQRDRIKTVTQDLPILVPCGSSEQDGVATFGPEFGTPKPVRVVSNADFGCKSRGMKEALSGMWVEEREQFRAILALISGLRKQDRLAIAKARDHVGRALAARYETDKKLGIAQSLEDDSDFGRSLISLFGLEPGKEKEALKRWGGYRKGPRAEADDRWLLSQLMTEALSSVRLVLWWSGTQLKPALYCPEAKAAVYTFLLRSIVVGKGWGLCPYCGDFFFRSRSDQNYCTIPHREAHRVARWRASKASKTERKGRTNGSSKTR